MKEIFKTIPSFPDYLVSNFGRVKTKSRKLRYTHAVTKKEHFRQSSERFLKVQFNNLTGYKFYQLYLNKKMHNKTIHQLVADAFLKKDKSHDTVNHKDGNKHNNTVDNLEWCTNKYNHEHATKTGLKPKGERVGTSKLTENSVHAIKWFLKKGVSHSELSKAFKVSRSNISQIAENKQWKHVSLTGNELDYKP
jgi:uncharacterized protein YlbG (UPF0298 family)